MKLRSRITTMLNVINKTMSYRCYPACYLHLNGHLTPDGSPAWLNLKQMRIDYGARKQIPVDMYCAIKPKNAPSA